MPVKTKEMEPVNLSAEIPQGLKDAIEKLASKDLLSMSAIVRTALMEYTGWRPREGK